MADKQDVPAGWYRDPEAVDEPRSRYWSGDSWSAQTRISSREWRRGVPPGLEQEPIPTSSEEASEDSSPPPSADATEGDGAQLTSTSRTSSPRHFGAWVLALLAAATIGILWSAAEQHDQSCYSRVAAQVASGNTDRTHCLILPWNDPVTAKEADGQMDFDY